MKKIVLVLFCFYVFSTLSYSQSELTNRFITRGLDHEKVIVKDYNNDGFLDVVSLDIGNGINLQPFLNFGNSTDFYLGEGISFPSVGYDFELIDIDNDGIDDIVYQDWEIYWLKGITESSFAEPEILLDLTFDDDIIEFVDYDNDEDLDISIVYENYGVVVAVNDGQGLFQEYDTIGYKPNSFLTKISFLDIDSDGDNDLVMTEANFLGNWEQNIVFLENEDLTFTDTVFIRKKFTKESVRTNFIDLNQDNLLDVVYHYSVDSVFIQTNLGDGTFSNQDTIDIGDLQSPSLEFIDVNADDLLDIVVLNGNSGEIGTMINLGGNAFGPVNVVYDLNSAAYVEVQVADIDLDGKSEMLYYRDGSLEYFKFDDDGNFSSIEHLQSYIFGGAFEQGDVNNDGLTDLLLFGSRTLSIYQQLTNGIYNRMSLVADTKSTSNFRNAKLLDFDEDGDLDILASGSIEDLSFYENSDGQGTFLEGVIVNDFAQEYIHINDIDDDGKADLISSSYDGIHICLRSAGPFTNSQFQIEEFNNSKIRGLDAFDKDGDGDIDVLIILNDGFAWVQNDGNEFSLVYTHSEEIGEVTRFETADVDLDGRKEIVIMVLDSGRKIKQFSSVDGTEWTESILLDDLGFSSYFELSYIDQDPYLDILVSSNSDFSSYYLSKQGVFNLESSFGEEDAWASTLDMNDDGFADFVFKQGQDISWSLNLLNTAGIQGVTYLDENENGQLDAGEIGLNGQKILVAPEDEFTFTFDAGRYGLFQSTGAYTISCLPSQQFKLTSPSSIDTTINNDRIFLNYGLIGKADIDLVEPDIVSGATRCGFTVPFWVDVMNDGVHIRDGKVEVILDPLVELIASNPSPDEQSGNSLIYYFEDIAPTYSKQIELDLRMPGVDFIGDSIKLIAMAELLDETDLVVAAKSFEYSSEINCAYDPNDKQVVQPIYPAYDNLVLLDDTLDYLIRFQNTGTDTAFNILIEDIISPDLDLSSFEMASTSHDARVHIDDDRKVSFYFDNIMLPDSFVNYQASQGYIKFRISALTDIQNQTNVYNSASIFFDFNPPIITNETHTVFVDNFPTNITNVVHEDLPLIYPNPAVDQLVIDVTDLKIETYSVVIFNQMGQSVLKSTTDDRIHKISLNRLDFHSGLYYVKIIGDRKSYVKAIYVSR